MKSELDDRNCQLRTERQSLELKAWRPWTLAIKVDRCTVIATKLKVGTCTKLAE